MEWLLDLYPRIDILVFVMSRILPSFFFLPIVTETKLPYWAQSGLALALSFIVMPSIVVDAIVYQPTLLGFTFVIIKEVAVGLILGFGVFMFCQIYLCIGQLLGLQAGLGMSRSFDPVNGTEVSSLGKFYSIGFGAFFVMTGGYHWFIKIIVESFTAIPINQGIIGAQVVAAIMDAMGVYFMLSFKIACPILAILFIMDCGLGILARTVPQMNMFVIGIPLKIIALFFLLIAIIGLTPSFNKIITDAITSTVMNIWQGLIP